MSEIVSRNGLAKALGVSLPTVDAWMRRGCPVQKRGGPGKPSEFDLDAVRRWVERYVSRGSKIVSNGKTFDASSPQRAAIIKAMGHVTAQTTGVAGRLAIAAGVDLRTAHAIEVLMNLEIDKATGSFLREYGVGEVPLSTMFGRKEDEIDWNSLQAERGEVPDEGEWWDHVEELRTEYGFLRKGSDRDATRRN